MVIKTATTGDPNDDLIDKSTIEGPGVKPKTKDPLVGDPHVLHVDTSKVGHGIPVHGDVRNTPDNTATLENSVKGLIGKSKT